VDVYLAKKANVQYRQIAQLKRCEVIPESAVKDVCLKAKEILMEEGNVQYVDSPVTVCRGFRSIDKRETAECIGRYVVIYMDNSST
jgi:hypothetical protein